MNTQQERTVVVGVAESVFQGWALRWAAEQAQLEGRALTLGPDDDCQERLLGPGGRDRDRKGEAETERETAALVDVLVVEHHGVGSAVSMMANA